MPRLSLAAVVASLAVTLGLADDTLKSPTPLPVSKVTSVTATELKPLEEVWEAAFVQNSSGVDVKIGHVHITVSGQPSTPAIGPANQKSLAMMTR